MPDHRYPAARVIGLLGGSFNPPHDGHLEISRAALSVLQIDVVWWLVSPASPLKRPEDYEAYEARCAAARALTDGERIEISDFEREEGLVYTVDTIERLGATFRDHQFIWLMGADSLDTFHLWKDWRRIAELAPIAVFNRPGYEDAPIESTAAKALSSYRIDPRQADRMVTETPPIWTFFSQTENATSSTEIRAQANRLND
ncbi:MAG: nicotinate (nicotinamide) nucleotide adenylyltransferase [Pseudomonadota bacterium]